MIPSTTRDDTPAAEYRRFLSRETDHIRRNEKMTAETVADRAEKAYNHLVECDDPAQQYADGPGELCEDLIEVLQAQVEDIGDDAKTHVEVRTGDA